MEFSSSHALSLKPVPPGSATGPEEKTFGAMPHMITTHASSYAVNLARMMVILMAPFVTLKA